MIRSLVVRPGRRRGWRGVENGREGRGGLWRGPFTVYWSATSVSTVGSGVTLVALPVLAAQQLSAGPAQLGYLRALETVPYLLLALPAGQLADRFPPLRLMVTADAVRAVLLAVTTVLALTGALRLGVLYLVVALVGACTAGYDVAQFTVLPALVPPTRLVPATSAVELARGAAFTAGPGLGGLLTALLRAGPVLLVDAASYVASALALTTLHHHGRPPRAAPVPAGHPLRRALGGARFVLRTGPLRALTAYLGVNNACNQAFLTGLIAYLEVDQRRPATEVGLAFGAYGAGFLLAATVAPRLGRLFGPRPNVIGSSVTSASGVGVLILSALAAPGSAASLTAAAGGALLVGFAAPPFNVHSVAQRLILTPDHLLGRVNAAVKLVSQGALPLGALAGGALFAALPATAAFAAVAVAVTSLLATAILLPVRLPPAR